jgi:hypothetical protein
MAHGNLILDSLPAAESIEPQFEKRPRAARFCEVGEINAGYAVLSVMASFAMTACLRVLLD